MLSLYTTNWIYLLRQRLPSGDKSINYMVKGKRDIHMIQNNIMQIVEIIFSHKL